MKRPSSGAIIAAILNKDFRLYGRDKMYLFLTILSLVLFVVVFWVSPDTVDETITIVVAPSLETMFDAGREQLLDLGVSSEQLAGFDREELAREEGLDLVELGTEDQVRRVISGELELYRAGDGSLLLHDPDTAGKRPADASRVRPDVGIVFPETLIADVVQGEVPTVTVYSHASVPGEIRSAMASFVREISYQIAGRELPVELPDEETVVLGHDRLGQPVALREKLRPMLVFFIFMVETLAMASLISTEVVQRTVTALLVTPMGIGQFLAAKMLFGISLASGQAVIVLALVGGFTPGNWPLLLVTVMIGAILFTSVAMFIGAAGKDFMGQLMYGMLFTVPLMIPAFYVLFPGTAAPWVRVIPSYPVIDVLVGVTLYDFGWAEASGALARALAWAVVLAGAGLYVLKRKVETL